MTIAISEITNNKIWIVWIIIFGVFTFLGFYWRRKIEKEKDFAKRINKKFVIKYIILFMLFGTSLCSFISYVIFFLLLDIENNIFWTSFELLLITVEWSFIYDYASVYSNLSKQEIIDNYMLFLSERKISNIKYSEIVTWFSWWNHNMFRTKNYNEQEADKLITKLELLLRPGENGFCLAAYHKEDFLELCAEWKKSNDEEKINKIQSIAEKMENKPHEKRKLFPLRLDAYALAYESIIPLHFVACMLVSDGKIANIIGNALFYIPSDILIILVYKGIIRERESN